MSDVVPVPTLYEWLGGMLALDKLMTTFYSRVPADPLLGPVFAHMSPDHSKHVAAFLAEVLGGPVLYRPSSVGIPMDAVPKRGRDDAELGNFPNDVLRDGVPPSSVWGGSPWQPGGHGAPLVRLDLNSPESSPPRLTGCNKRVRHGNSLRGGRRAPCAKCTRRAENGSSPGRRSGACPSPIGQPAAPDRREHVPKSPPPTLDHDRPVTLRINVCLERRLRVVRSARRK
jgi:hypothetical protein